VSTLLPVVSAVLVTGDSSDGSSVMVSGSGGVPVDVGGSSDLSSMPVAMD